MAQVPGTPWAYQEGFWGGDQTPYQYWQNVNTGEEMGHPGTASWGQGLPQGVYELQDFDRDTTRYSAYPSAEAEQAAQAKLLNEQFMKALQSSNPWEQAQGIQQYAGIGGLADVVNQGGFFTPEYAQELGPYIAARQAEASPTNLTSLKLENLIKPAIGIGAGALIGATAAPYLGMGAGTSGAPGAGATMPAAAAPSFADIFQIPAGEIFTEGALPFLSAGAGAAGIGSAAGSEVGPYGGFDAAAVSGADYGPFTFPVGGGGAPIVSEGFGNFDPNEIITEGFGGPSLAGGGAVTGAMGPATGAGAGGISTAAKVLGTGATAKALSQSELAQLVESGTTGYEGGFLEDAALQELPVEIDPFSGMPSTAEAVTPRSSISFGDKPGYQIPWQSLIGSGAELFGKRKDRKLQEEMMKRALESDPWRDQQSRYFEPTYEAATKGIGNTAYGDSILREVMSREASRGFGQSPRMLQEMARGLNLGTADYLRAISPLATGRGGQGDVYSDFARNLGGSRQQEMGSLGKLFRDLMRGGQPSSADREFGGERPRRNLPEQLAQLFLT